MLDWLGGWVTEPPIERKSRKRARGPSWQFFWVALGVGFGAGACAMCELLAAITPHG
jgi:hypothetical protein